MERVFLPQSRPGRLPRIPVPLPLLVSIAIAQEKDQLEKELLFFAEEEITVTATKHEQSIEEAPAIVTVITHEQIKKSGYRSIVELLKDVMGVDIIDNVARVEVGMRGINNKSDYGKHILFLLNGYEVIEARTGEEGA